MINAAAARQYPAWNIAPSITLSVRLLHDPARSCSKPAQTLCQGRRQSTLPAQLWGNIGKGKTDDRHAFATADH
jgi:hypothetical protein